MPRGLPLLRSIPIPPMAVWGFRKVVNNKLPLCRAHRTGDNGERDIFADNNGFVDVADILSWAGKKRINLMTCYHALPRGPSLNFPSGERPVLANGGVVNTNNGVLVATTDGACIGYSDTMPLTWSRDLVMNIVFLRGSTPLTNAWVLGADAAGSSYRDCEIFVPARSTKLSLGEDMNADLPDNGVMGVNTASIITAIRTATGASPRGSLRQNGMVMQTITTDRVSPSAEPTRICVFGDPDGGVGGFAKPGLFAPAGWGFQEIIIWNDATPPALDSIMAVEKSQSDFYNIPLFDSPAVPYAVDYVGAAATVVGQTVSLWPTNGLMAEVNGQPVGFLTTDPGDYFLEYA